MSESVTAQLTREFSDLLSSGTMQQGVALAEEADEPLLKALPRLIFRFNRQQFGRLVELIRRVNELGVGV